MSIDDLRMWYAETFIKVSGIVYFVNELTVARGGKLGAICTKLDAPGRFAEETVNLPAEDLDFLMPEPMYCLDGSGWQWVSRRKRNTYRRGATAASYNIGSTEAWHRFLLAENPYGLEFSGVVAVSPYVLVELNSGVIERAEIMGGTMRDIRQFPKFMQDFIYKEAGDAYQ